MLCFELTAFDLPVAVLYTLGRGCGTGRPSTLNSIKYNYLPSISFTLSTIVCSSEPSVVSITRDAPRRNSQNLFRHARFAYRIDPRRSEEHTSELQSRFDLVC